jgi:hypothetical protein
MGEVEATAGAMVLPSASVLRKRAAAADSMLVLAVLLVIVCLLV